VCPGKWTEGDEHGYRDRRSSRTSTTLGAGWSTYLGSLEVMAASEGTAIRPIKKALRLAVLGTHESLGKFGIVMAGYGAAIVAGWSASWQYNARVAGLPYDTSAACTPPARRCTRPPRSSWSRSCRRCSRSGSFAITKDSGNTMSVASLAFAAVGLVAVFSPLLFPTTPRHIGSLVVQLFEARAAPGRASVVPGLRLFAFMAPTRASRRVLVAATAIELVIGVCALGTGSFPPHESELPEHGQLAARSDPVLLHLHEIDPEGTADRNRPCRPIGPDTFPVPWADPRRTG